MLDGLCLGTAVTWNNGCNSTHHCFFEWQKALQLKRCLLAALDVFVALMRALAHTLLLSSMLLILMMLIAPRK
jgi:hypothetical protein